MPRDLGDVLHLFAPELGPDVDPLTARRPLVGIPFARPDAVRSALLWNLAVEASRQSARTALVAPGALGGAALADAGVLGVEAHRVEAGPSMLVQCADEALRRLTARGRGLVLAAFPAAWLQKGADVAPLMGWTLVFVRPDESSLREAAASLEAVASQSPQARLGVTVYGVRSLLEARDCFEHLALGLERRFGSSLTSYGVLVDDVHLSRSIVTGRPIALANAHTPAARALADVATLLLGDE
ncbi:MAG: hypothetical protein DCC71_05645 [Proteobacteria bacterium]|nr:MAG: hypothetical protein DCC71_05645 [Pseudomonadota bacterium]